MPNVGLPPSLLAPETATTVAARVALLEGPAVDEKGRLYFSDIFANRIYAMTPEGQVSVFRDDSGRTNGNTFDAQGRLISCEGAEQGPGGRRRIVRTDLKTGNVEVLTEHYEGKRYNSPNDVCVDTKGRIWFTDPLLRRRPLGARDGRRGRLPHRPRRHGHPRPHAAGDRAAQRLRDHAGAQDPLRRRQPQSSGRQSQDLGVRRRRRRHPHEAAHSSTTSAKAAAATACGST